MKRRVPPARPSASPRRAGRRRRRSRGRSRPARAGPRARRGRRSREAGSRRSVTGAQTAANPASSRNPATLDFSGWNWTPKVRSRSTTHAKRSPHAALPTASSRRGRVRGERVDEVEGRLGLEAAGSESRFAAPIAPAPSRCGGPSGLGPRGPAPRPRAPRAPRPRRSRSRTRTEAASRGRSPAAAGRPQPIRGRSRSNPSRGSCSSPPGRRRRPGARGRRPPPRIRHRAADLGRCADPLQRLLDRAQVPHPVVEDADAGRRHVSVPFVEGTPFSSGSIATASRSALANALKQASIMWWAFVP